MQKFFITLSLVCTLAACGTNPVTGDRQLTLMSQEQEIALGEQHYTPSQQMQGGVYLLDSELNHYIDRIGQTLAKQSAQPDLPYEFIVLNSSIPNAWALPGGKIAINRGLLVLLEDEAQLAAVLGHEIVHAAARHGAARQARGTLLQGSALLVGALSSNQLYGQAAGILAMGASARYSRDNELEADKYGMNIMSAAGYSVLGAVELQQTFLKLSKSRGQKRDFFSDFLASHPPSEERVKKNRNRSDRFAKGTRNESAYLRATQKIRDDQPAYTLHDQALEAASKKAWKESLSFTEKAIKRLPNEARFHVTKGRLLEVLERKPSKINDAFSTAIKLEPTFFAPHLYRGMHHNKQKRYRQAQRDLLASYKILPTQTSAFYLGEIAQRNRQTQDAIAYYREAEQGRGELGKKAGERLQKLGVR